MSKQKKSLSEQEHEAGLPRPLVLVLALGVYVAANHLSWLIEIKV